MSKISLARNWKKRRWFHGGPIIEVDNRLSDEEIVASLNWDRDRTTSDLNAEGPGFYCTTDADEAKRYGEHLYQVRVRDGFVPIPGTFSRKMLSQIVRSLVEQSSGDRLFDLVSDLGVDPSGMDVESMSEAVSLAYSKEESFVDALILLYHDLFRYNSKEFVLSMVRTGYDGFIVDKTDRFHMIVWNMRAIDLALTSPGSKVGSARKMRAI